MVTEQQLELKDQKLAAMFGWATAKIVEGGGAADRIYFKQGFCFTVERKKPKGRLSRDQEQYAEFLSHNGTPHFVLWENNQEGMRMILIEMEERLANAKVD